MAAKKDEIVAGQKPSRTESAELTPLMIQYLTIKDQHRDEVLFFRLGDFYEMFNEDAVEVSRLLNLTLTHRGSQPMCGIPYHAAKIYIARLLRLGKKIAICEQVGEIAKGKGLTERKVIEIITPGTAVESEYLDGGNNNFLAAMNIGKNGVGFAYIDVTTSDFFATSWAEKDMADNFSKELGRCRPRELLLPEFLRNSSVIQDSIAMQEGMSVSYYPAWNFDSGLSYNRLVNQFKVANLKSFGLSEASPEVAPAGFLLDYLVKCATTEAPHVSEIKIYKDSQFVVMDDSSRRNLEILSNLRDGTSKFTLLESVANTQTAMGNRLLRSWLMYPLTNSRQIKTRQSHVELFVNNRQLLDFVHEKLNTVLDVERLAARVAMERAHAKDLQALRASLESWVNIRGQIADHGFSSLDENIAVEIIDLIKKSILDDPATSLTEGRIIRDGYSEELDHYRDIQANFSRILEEYAEEERLKTGISNLRIKNSNNAGYYIEVTKGKLSAVPSHFIMRRSMMNAERYTTERLQELEHELNDAASRIMETEKNLFIYVRSQIAHHVPYLMATAREIAYADVTSGYAYSAILHNWVKPVIDDSRDFEISNGRHPVVEMHIPQGEFVPNDISMSRTFALITGPNMAGKSTYLRQNALIALLAQTGSYVPADSAHIGVVDRIFCRVGASDNLARGESTFLVEMTETANILRSATDRSLVIMDEVGRGTSTEDGLSIAWAVSEYLLNTIKCKTLFATHYHELTRMDHPELRLLCMAVNDTNGSVVFLRKVKEGAAENSYGIHVARLAGVPSSVIERAGEILNHLQKTAMDDSDNKVSGLETSTISAQQKIKPSSSMPGLFSDEELVLEAILSTDPDNLTPRQALDLISQWKNSLSGR